MKIAVTKDHIKYGEAGSDNECPIALAFSEIFPNETIEVDGNNVIISRSQRSFQLPKRARNFIDTFDKRKPVKPFTFTI